MINLSSFIAFHARRTPERCALKYRGENISYASFDARIRTVAGWLASRGIGAGDVVAVLMKNSAAFGLSRLVINPRRNCTKRDRLTDAVSTGCRLSFQQS